MQLFFIFHFITEHSQVTPGLPMLQSFVYNKHYIHFILQHSYTSSYKTIQYFTCLDLDTYYTLVLFSCRIEKQFPSIVRR